MMMQYRYLIAGDCPVLNRAESSLLACMDVDIDNAYVKQGYILQLKAGHELTQDERAKLEHGIKYFHEQEGWMNVQVWPVGFAPAGAVRDGEGRAGRE